MTAVAKDDLAALREGAAFCSPDQRFLVRATGADVVTWLDRLLSLPVADLAAGGVVDACLMDGKGKLRTDLRVVAPGAPADGLLLDLPLSHREALLRLLDMYVIKEDVAFADLSTELRSASLVGPKAAEVLRAAGVEPPEAGRVACPSEDVFVLPTMLAAAGYDLFFDGAVGRDLVDGLFAAGAVRTDAAALRVARVVDGVAWFADDLATDVIPLEANLDARVSIHKGCYPGQEVVARILNLGQVARRLLRLAADGEHALEPGTELVDADGKAVGTLTSCAHDPDTGRTHALAFVKRKGWAEGTTLTAGDATFTVLGPSAG